MAFFAREAVPPAFFEAEPPDPAPPVLFVDLPPVVLFEVLLPAADDPLLAVLLAAVPDFEAPLLALFAPGVAAEPLFVPVLDDVLFAADFPALFWLERGADFADVDFPADDLDPLDFAAVAPLDAAFPPPLLPPATLALERDVLARLGEVAASTAAPRAPTAAPVAAPARISPAASITLSRTPSAVEDFLRDELFDPADELLFDFEVFDFPAMFCYSQ